MSLFSFFKANAWNFASPVGGRSSAMAYSSVALRDFWSICNNPAGISTWKDLSMGVYYENRFLMKELGYKNIALIIPLNIGIFGISANQFGYNFYNENLIGITYSRDFGPYINIGLKLDYISMKFAEDYAKKSTATFEIGFQSNITENLTIGTYVFNPIHAKFKTLNRDKIPIIMRLGVAYNVSEDFLMTAEVERNTETSFHLRCGCEYQVIETFAVRTGVQTNPGIFCFGCGYCRKWMNINISANLHQKLGTSIQCGMVLSLKNNRPKIEPHHE